MLLDVQVPVFEQPLLRCLPRQALALVCLDLELATTIQIHKMSANGLEGICAAAQHLHHDFRSASDRPLDQLDCRERQMLPSTRSTPRVARNVEKRLAS